MTYLPDFQFSSPAFSADNISPPRNHRPAPPPPETPRRSASTITPAEALDAQLAQLRAAVDHIDARIAHHRRVLAQFDDAVEAAKQGHRTIHLPTEGIVTFRQLFPREIVAYVEAERHSWRESLRIISGERNRIEERIRELHSLSPAPSP
jgi:hypothetical protein